MSFSSNRNLPSDLSTNPTKNYDETSKSNCRSKRSTSNLDEPIAIHVETLCSVHGDSSIATLSQGDSLTHPITDVSFPKSDQCNDESLRDNFMPPCGSSWPNVAEGQKMRVLKNRTFNETFAQKLQVGVTWKNMMCHSAIMTNPETDVKNLECQPILLSSVDDHKFIDRDSSLLNANKKTKDANTSKLPPNDSGVHLIESSLKEKWTQHTVKTSTLTPKEPPQLAKDFPDLSTALKMLSKCSIRNDSFELRTDSTEITDKKTKSRKKMKSNQPCRRDPISVNLADFLKEAHGTSKRFAPTDRRILVRNIEKIKICGNILDSSNPIRKRGKCREKPPKKRLTKLKQIIINERCKKKVQKELNLETTPRNNLVSGSQCSKSLVGTICSQLNSLQITNENVDKNHTCPIPKIIELKIGDVKEIERTSEYCDNQEQTNVPSLLHSRKFRNYCNNIRCHELDDAATNLLKEIYRFQDRHYKKDPIKAHAKRRFILGIREVKKFLMLKKLRAIVIAPDLEPVEGPGGLDETILQIREEGRVQQVPVIFAVGRRQLGFTLRKKVPISIIGIINAEGAEELFSLMLKKWHEALVTYQEKAVV